MKELRMMALLTMVLLFSGCGAKAEDMCKNVVGVEACEQKKRCAQEIKLLGQRLQHDCAKSIDTTTRRLRAVYKTRTEKKKKVRKPGERTQLEFLASALMMNDKNIQRVVEFFTDILEKDFDHPVAREKKILKFLEEMISHDRKR